MARHPFSDSPEYIEGRFKQMDEAGVEKQVLSPNRARAKAAPALAEAPSRRHRQKILL
jgi:hypothetical protein